MISLRKDKIFLGIVLNFIKNATSNISNQKPGDKTLRKDIIFVLIRYKEGYIITKNVKCD